MSPADAEALCKQGRKAVRKGDYVTAQDLFHQVVDDDPDNPDAHEGLATAMYLAGAIEEAIPHFDRVTKLKPRDAKGYINLGALFNQLERYKEAADTLRKAIQRDGKSAEAYYNLGIAQKNLKQNAMAVSAYRECVRLKPDMAEAHLNLANLYVEQKNERKAIEHYEKALEARPEFERAQRGLNHILGVKEQRKQEESPFGRLVDTEKLVEKDAVIEEARELTETERFDDRQFLQVNAGESLAMTEKLFQHLKQHMEPTLLSINRIMAQDMDQQRELFAIRDRFHESTRFAEQLFNNLHKEIAGLREHEEQYKP